MPKYWNTTERYSKFTPTYERNGAPRMSAETLIFAQMRGVILHIRAFDPECANQSEWDHVDSMEVFYGYTVECGYQPLRDAFNEIEDGYQRFMQYWKDCK